MKVLLILYDAGSHAKDEPKLLGCTENELGIRDWLESQGHTLVTTSSKDGADSVLDKEIVDADVVITTPFHPGYINKERIDKAKKLKICITAGVGSDHVDLDAANARDIAVLEVTGSNVQSVAEHVVMTMLVLVRNFVPAHEQIISGGWDVAAVAKDSYDLEGKVIGTVGGGRIGQRVLKRCKPFDPMEMLYYDYQPMPADVEKEIGCRRVESLEEMLSLCDVVTINCPLHASTKGLFNKELISHMKNGAWLVNTARGAICVTEDIVEALESGKIRGYGGDVWFPQPAPKDHPWRTMRNKYGGGNAMTPHISGTSIDAQGRYAEGTKKILEVFFSGKQDYRPQDIICINGHYGTKAYGDDKEHKERKMFVVGHSLGAAQAQLFATQFKLLGFDPYMINFGQPRLGNPEFAAYINQLWFNDTGLVVNDARRFYRVTHWNDIVVGVPDWLNYTHSIGEVFIDEESVYPKLDKVVVCEGGENPLCHRGTFNLWSRINFLQNHLAYIFYIGLCAFNIGRRDVLNMPQYQGNFSYQHNIDPNYNYDTKVPTRISKSN